LGFEVQQAGEQDRRHHEALAVLPQISSLSSEFVVRSAMETGGSLSHLKPFTGG
jgi:hypothetical protein